MRFTLKCPCVTEPVKLQDCVDPDPPRPTKTILALMINFMYSTPALIARLLPIFYV